MFINSNHDKINMFLILKICNLFKPGLKGIFTITNEYTNKDNKDEILY